MYVLFFFIFLIIPAILGVADILHSLKLTMLSTEDKGRNFNCVFLEEENAVMRMKFFAEDNNWNGVRVKKVNYAIYENLSQEVHKECLSIANKNDIRFLNLEEFNREIKEI